MFTIQRYLQPDLLRERGIHNFDAWAAMFGEGKTILSLQPDGSYRPETRFAEFINMSELAQMWADIGDVVRVDDMPYMKGVRPEVRGGRMQIIVGQQTQAQRDYKKVLADRMEAIRQRRGPAQKGDDILLAVITDGRHAALDQRFIDPSLPADPDSKIEKVIANTFERLEGDKGKEATPSEFLLCSP